MKSLICHYSNNPNLEEKFGRNPDVLKEHNIDNIFLILETEFGDSVLQQFFSMVGFDCLIGHGDRHWTNYGVIVEENSELKYKFSPIYDTASGYLLELTDKKLKETIRSGKLNDEKWYWPKKKGLCKMTCNGDIKTNHMELFKYILGNENLSRYVPSLVAPIKNLDLSMVNQLLKGEGFEGLTADRKFTISKVLEMRKKILDSIIIGGK